MTTVYVKSGARGLLVEKGQTKSRTSMYYRCDPNSSDAVGIWMDGAGLTLGDVWTSGGYGVHATRGQAASTESIWATASPALPATASWNG
jgi:hypothetical protein